MNKLYKDLPQAILDAFQNEQIVQEAKTFYSKNKSLVGTMFGYPANNIYTSKLTQYLLLLHYTSPFSNNCGDIDEEGNYALDTKKIEKKIVGIFADKFDLGNDYWGYITSGGSESNSCGISLAFAKNPNGILYYSSAAHYSVEKYARYYRCIEIPTIEKDYMNLEILFDQILKNFKKLGAPANIILTHGTTKYGISDDVDKIISFLKKNEIPYYIHMDAALFGGVPNNQVDAPLLTKCKERGIHSVSVSFHKYLGFPDVMSVFVSSEKPFGNKIAYIGQRDTTISGSRSIPAYALLNHLNEQLNKEDIYEYSRNIKFFEQKLKENNIVFFRGPHSNIFVIDAPSESICSKYQLSCFEDNNMNKAHIIIFPNHTEENMLKLIYDIK